MIILCGPSACGKTEIAKYLSQAFSLKKVVTNTTREKRIGEVNHVDYNFITKEEFLKLKDQDLFVETTCYNNNFYGCLKSEIADDKVVILEPEGVKNFLKLNDHKLCVFYLEADEQIRIDRMRYRKDKEEDIAKRISNDRIAFNSENLPPFNYLINTEKITIEEGAKQIITLYQYHLDNLK